MKIKNVVHQGLRQLIENDDASGLRPTDVPKLQRIASFIQDMEREDELRTISSWKAHQLTVDHKGAWSLWVSANGQITFCIDCDEIEIISLDDEDYH